jgi:S1-C subfamily serine protease
MDITPEVRKGLDIPARITGVVVADIEQGSPAEGVLAKNDVILEINKKRIRNLKEYEAVSGTVKSGQSMLVLIYRNGFTTYLTLSP